MNTIGKEGRALFKSLLSEKTYAQDKRKRTTPSAPPLVECKKHSKGGVAEANKEKLNTTYTLTDRGAL